MGRTARWKSLPESYCDRNNDGINVEVVSGLSQGEEVVTSLSAMNPTAKTAQGDQNGASPFMPKMRRRDNSKAK